MKANSTHRFVISFGHSIMLTYRVSTFHQKTGPLVTVTGKTGQQTLQWQPDSMYLKVTKGLLACVAIKSWKTTLISRSSS